MIPIFSFEFSIMNIVLHVFGQKFRTRTIQLLKTTGNDEKHRQKFNPRKWTMVLGNVRTQYMFHPVLQAVPGTSPRRPDSPVMHLKSSILCRLPGWPGLTLTPFSGCRVRYLYGTPTSTEIRNLYIRKRQVASRPVQFTRKRQWSFSSVHSISTARRKSSLSRTSLLPRLETGTLD